MQVIPVVDLLGGVVVHARRGQRERYQPVQSRLCDGAEPRTVVEALLRLHPFPQVYVADLEALMGRAGQTALIEGLCRAFPQVRFWIDGGMGGGVLLGVDNAVPVIGSESLTESSLGWPKRTRAILSLDFRDGELLGPKALLDAPHHWPDTVILMSLSHVGSDLGPDFRRVAEFQNRYPQHRWVAAGGVRHAGDLEQLKALGVAAALVASALHDGRIDARTLAHFP